MAGGIRVISFSHKSSEARLLEQTGSLPTVSRYLRGRRLARAAKASDCDRGAAIGGKAPAGARLAHGRGGEDADRNRHAEPGCSEGAPECGGPGAGEGELAG